jgi:hypothetical protein
MKGSGRTGVRVIADGTGLRSNLNKVYTIALAAATLLTVMLALMGCGSVATQVTQTGETVSGPRADSIQILGPDVVPERPYKILGKVQKTFHYSAFAKAMYGSATKVNNKTKRKVIRSLRDEAATLGADAVIRMHDATSTATSCAGGYWCSGLAIKYVDAVSSRQPAEIGVAIVVPQAQSFAEWNASQAKPQSEKKYKKWKENRDMSLGYHILAAQYKLENKGYFCELLHVPSVEITKPIFDSLADKMLEGTAYCPAHLLVFDQSDSTGTTFVWGWAEAKTAASLYSVFDHSLEWTSSATGEGRQAMLVQMPRGGFVSMPYGDPSESAIFAAMTNLFATIPDASSLRSTIRPK